MQTTSIGIDPGWVNLGFAVVTKDEGFKVKVLSSKTLNPSKSKSLEEFTGNIPHLVLACLPNPVHDFKVSHLVVERYVPYANVFTAETENISTLIGMLRMQMYLTGVACQDKIATQLFRAIEWKVQLVQLLSKYAQFQNPSSSLDKGFSLAAAKFISVNPEVIQTDHEADAICLAAFPLLVQEAKTRLGIPPNA
jgi:Holliday junction resolvasome RuvABC endonuclease subunit